jgi:hypothetical protein
VTLPKHVNERSKALLRHPSGAPDSEMTNRTTVQSPTTSMNIPAEHEIQLVTPAIRRHNHKTLYPVNVCAPYRSSHSLSELHPWLSKRLEWVAALQSFQHPVEMSIDENTPVLTCMPQPSRHLEHVCKSGAIKALCPLNRLQTSHGDGLQRSRC